MGYLLELNASTEHDSQEYLQENDELCGSEILFSIETVGSKLFNRNFWIESIGSKLFNRIYWIETP